MANTPAFKLRFNCKLAGIFKGDNVFIKTKEDRFADTAYPGHVIAEVIAVEEPACGLFNKSKVWRYTFSPITAMPEAILALEECDVEGIRLSQSCCIISGEWRGDEIVLTKEDGGEIVIPPPDINCSLDDADFNEEVELPDV